MITDKQLDEMGKNLAALHGLSERIDPALLTEMIKISDDPRADDILPIASRAVGLNPQEFDTYVRRIKFLLFFVVEFRKIK